MKYVISLTSFLAIFSTSLYSQELPALVIESGQELMTSSPDQIVFSKNNRYLAIAGNAEIRLYDLKTGLFFKKIKQENDYSFVQFSYDFSHYTFTRLQNMNEPDDSHSFTAAAETFTNKYIYQQPHKTNNYGNYIRPVNQYILRRTDKLLEFINPANRDQVLFTTTSSNYDIDDEQNKLIVGSQGEEKFTIIGLANFDTLNAVDFSRNADSNTTTFEKDIKKTYGSLYILPPALRFSGNRFIYFLGEYYSQFKVFKIYDTKKDTVIFSKVYSSNSASEEIFLRSINFSGLSGAVSIPDKNGLKIFNAYSKDSFLIPLTKTNIRAEAYLGGDGKHIIINNNESILVYNIASKKKILDLPEKSIRVFVNPAYPLIYFTTHSFASDGITLIFDTQKEQMVDTVRAELIQLSPDGKLFYGRVGWKNYLFNQHVLQVKEINSCTPYTNKVFESKGNYAVLVNDNSCNYTSRLTIPDFDFSAWNLNTLAKIPNDLTGVYTFDYARLRGSFFQNDNFYLTSGYTLHSFTDTTATNRINNKYGDLKNATGDYLVYVSGSFQDFLSGNGEGGDTITVIRNTKLVCRFRAAGIATPSVGIDTIRKQIVVFSDVYTKTGIKKLSLFNYAGVKITEKEVYAPAPGIEPGNATILGISADNNFVWFTTEASFSSDNVRQIVLNMTTGKKVVDFSISPVSIFNVNCNAGKYLYPDSNQFVSIGTFTNSKRVIKAYPLAVKDSLLLALRPPDDYTSFQPASLLLTRAGEHTLFLCNWIKGDTIYKTRINGDFVKTGAISKDKKWIAVANNNNQIMLTHLTGNKTYILPGHTDYISGLSFSYDCSKLVSCSVDGSVKIWSLDSLKEIVTIINLKGEDYIITSPEGYYTCSKTARNQFGFFANGTVLSPDQLDIFYNRPDMLLKKMGSGDTARVEALYHAWEKRVKKSGVRGSNIGQLFNAPQLEITNADSIETNTSNGKLTLQIHSTDNSAGILTRFNIWINQCPVFGAGGIKLADNAHVFDTLLFVQLSKDSNIIECAVTNANGIESYRQPLFTRYTAFVKKPATWFVGIGVSNYKQPGKMLHYATKDILDLDSIFKSGTGIEKSQYHSLLLLDGEVTKEKVMALRDSLLHTAIDDKVILAFSGHGLMSDSLDFYLATADADFDKPEIRGLSYQAFENILDSIPARNKLVLIDACHSGETDEDEKKTGSISDIFSQRVDQVKEAAKTKKLGLQNSFDLMQELFSNLNISTGATVISAARGNEAANEGDEWRNGAFTFCIKEGLVGLQADADKNGHVTIGELKKFVLKEVKRITNERQQPTSRQETVRNDWVIW